MSGFLCGPAGDAGSVACATVSGPAEKLSVFSCRTLAMRSSTALLESDCAAEFPTASAATPSKTVASEVIWRFMGLCCSTAILSGRRGTAGILPAIGRKSCHYNTKNGMQTARGRREQMNWSHVCTSALRVEASGVRLFPSRQ